MPPQERDTPQQLTLVGIRAPWQPKRLAAIGGEAISAAVTSRTSGILEEDAAQQLIMEGFEPVPLLEEVEQSSKKPARRRLVAFGGFVKSEQYDVFGDYDLSKITDEARLAVQPTVLVRALFKRSFESHQTVEGVPLSSFEHKIILRARDPKYLGDVAFSHVLDSADEITDERIAAATRGFGHAINDRLERMRTHRDALSERKEALFQLKERIRMPGYGHLEEEEMNALLSAVWQEFLNMLDVARLQLGWSDDQRKHAQAALIERLATGPQRTRIKNWGQMTNLAIAYVGSRIKLFDNRIEHAQEGLSLHEAVQPVA